MPFKNPGLSRVFYVWAEFITLFAGGPLLILSCRRPGILFLVLWLGGCITYLASRPAPGGTAAPKAADIRNILLRFLAGGALLTAASWALFPRLFLSLPRQHPVFWAVIMVLYPVLSVWPQEVIYRRFLFHRYTGIFGPRGIIAASALAFGFAHVIFLNGIAVALTTAGGALFAWDYARHRKLELACLEHALYGCLVFTIGLGRFFYTGAAWHH